MATLTEVRNRLTRRRRSAPLASEIAEALPAPADPNEQPFFRARYPVVAAGLMEMGQAMCDLSLEAGFPRDASRRVRIGVLEAGHAMVTANGGGDYIEVIARVSSRELWIVLSQEGQGLCSRSTSLAEESISVVEEVCDIVEPLLIDNTTAFWLRFWPGPGPL